MAYPLCAPIQHYAAISGVPLHSPLAGSCRAVQRRALSPARVAFFASLDGYSSVEVRSKSPAFTFITC